MIIVEGSDKVGKSTLCKKLAEKLGTRVYPWGLLPDDFDFFWGYTDRMEMGAVWDRGWLSEIAYTSVLKRKVRFTYDHQAMANTAALLYGVVHVVVVAAPMMLMKRLLREPDDKFDGATVLVVNDWFEKNYRSHPCDVVISCTEDHPFPDDLAISTILDKYRRKEAILKKVIGDGLCLSKILQTPTASCGASAAAVRSPTPITG